MTITLLSAAVIIFACVIFNRFSGKIGVPALLLFILLGMFFGSDGFVKISFDNFDMAEQLCSVALLFIMFYGGFGTKWSQARPVAAKAILLSSLGTILTALLVGLFCHILLHIAPLESFLIGSVISSTDAASVFSILRSRRLNLKYNTASLLEVESGSNDPFAYMLTIIALSLMEGKGTPLSFTYLIFSQIVYGALFGLLIAGLSYIFLKRFHFHTSGYDAIFIVAVALISFSLPTILGGNGYLSAYLTGLLLGNAPINNKPALAHFFDGMTGLMQMLLFFLLGLLSTPHLLPSVALPALAIAVFLTFIARPLVIFFLLAPYRSSFKQMLFVSWAGMRGAASIVFAIIAVIHPAVMAGDIFHMVFFIVLFSVLCQGTLLSPLSRWLSMTDEAADVMKTFTDYSDEVPVQFIQFAIPEHHAWCGRPVRDIHLPPECILVLLMRGQQKIVPRGKTVLTAGDVLILSGVASSHIDGVHLYEKEVSADDAGEGKQLSEISTANHLVIMIRRGAHIIIPKGSTRLRAHDILVINTIE